MHSICLKELKKVVPQELIYKKVGDRELHLYIFPPKEEVKGCIINIHGGGWTGGTPKLLYSNAACFSENGGLGICVEYRLHNVSQGCDVRECLEDCVDALAFIRDYVHNAYGELPITVLGDSAGSHLATCLGCQAIIDRVRKDVKRADFIVDCNGIVDLTSKWGYAIETKETDTEDQRTLQIKYSPLFNIESTDAGVLIIHGDADDIVSIEDSYAYYEQLQKMGVESKMITLPNAKHAFILFDYVHDNEFVADTMHNVVVYLKDKNLM